MGNFPIVDEAKACGWSGFLTVQAALQAEMKVGSGGRQHSWAGELKGYAHPTYFGMMAAAFDRLQPVPRQVLVLLFLFSLLISSPLLSSPLPSSTLFDSVLLCSRSPPAGTLNQHTSLGALYELAC